jgi:predicted lipoprotein
MKRLIRFYFPLLLILALGQGCNKDDKKDPDTSFNRVLMLEHYRDALIKPAYSAATAEATALSQASLEFTANPSAEGLNNMKTKWTAAILAWQKACMFNFGPAAEQGVKKSLQEELSTFPVNLSKVDQILAGGGYNVNDFNRDARGLLTIEYVIFGYNQTSEEVLLAFESSIRKEFLNALCADVASRLLAVSNQWQSYGTEFVNNSGTDAGSSVSALYNQFVGSFEAIKNFKFGLPLGLRPGQTAVEPALLEARFSKISFRLAKAHFEAIAEVYRGKDENKALKAYVNSVTGGKELVNTTEAQLALIENLFDNQNENLDMEEMILTNPQPLIDIHTELQKHTKNFKSDMSSLLGIAITFSSGDGD